MEPAPVRYGEHPRVTAGTPCMLCAAPQDRPHTDHCHRHGWVRGILCPRCNSKMAYIDRLLAPPGSTPVPLEAFIAFAGRCPDCPRLTRDDISGDLASLPVHPAGQIASERGIVRVRVEGELWIAYAEVVGNGGRSADLKAYIDWRVDHPDEPLPGKWRGPVKRERRRHTTA